MKLNGKTALICNCRGTMPIDAAALGAALGTEAPPVHTELCRTQLARFEAALATGTPLVVACTQEAPLFRASAEEQPDAELIFANIRECAGWSEEASAAAPKMAALLAMAAVDTPPVSHVSLKAAEDAVIYGTDERAIEAARQLGDRLTVRVLLAAPRDVPPPRIADAPIYAGRILRASGHLGAFELELEGCVAALPSSRRALEFASSDEELRWRCSLLLDLTGGAPLFPGFARRDGYLRPDPGDSAAVQRALFDMLGLVGEFEKPRYVAYDAAICAHSRSRKIGCTRCLDACPTGAIVSQGDAVAIDPMTCAGCGNCASLCPTGAASYAFPADAVLFEQLRTLVMTYLGAGGRDAVLLLHDARHGAEMISLLAHHGPGLAARVLPFEINEITMIGVDFLFAAFAYGATRVLLLGDPHTRHERVGLGEEIALVEAVLRGLGYGEDRVALIEEADPLAVAELVNAAGPAAPDAASFLALGAKRSRAMLALQHLHDHAPTPVDLVPLPRGAPFGAVALDAAGCTLCLSCVGACPTGALQDNPDKPMLSFVEEACVQCGLCRTVCPESVIRLVPRLNFAKSARSPIVLKEEEPATCVRCGKPFGAKSSIERIVAQLAGKHAMFASPDAIARIRMCEDCRIIAQFEARNPLAAAPPRRPRTAEDE